VHAGVSVTDVRGVGGGRGLVVTAPGGLARDTRFLSLPLHVLVTPHVFAALRERADASLPRPVNDLDALALWIGSERARGASARYAPYVECLPRDGADTAFRWSDDELAARLRDAEARRAALAMREDVARRAAALADPLAATYAVDVSLVQSRVFSAAALSKASGVWVTSPALVPLADMMNLAPPPRNATADCRTNDASTRFDCFALCDLAFGAELLAPLAGVSAHADAHARRDFVWAHYGFESKV